MTTQHAFDRLEKLSPSDRAAVELKYDGSIPEDFTVPNFAPVTSDITAGHWLWIIGGLTI